MAEPQLHQPNIIGQLSIEFYTVILLGFALSPSVSQQDVVAVLKKATHALTDCFPFLAGRVILEGRNAHHSGTYRVVGNGPPSPARSPLSVKDRNGDCASFEDFVDAKAPASMLDGEILAPMQGLPKNYDPTKDESPVFRVQANFVNGGLLLCFACQHNVIDMNGQGKVIHLFAQACQGESLVSSKAGIPNRVPLLADGEVQSPHEGFRCASRLVAQAESHGSDNDHPSAPWRYYRFPKSKLVELKQTATKAESEVPWISTNDAVTALMWQRINAARSTRIPPDQTTKILRMVNGMNHLSQRPDEDEFMVMLPTLTTFGIGDLLDAPLSSIANNLRRTLLAVNDYHVRSWATLITSVEDKTTINPGASITGNDLIVSSWADLGLAKCDFGSILGTPDFCRRPRMGDSEGLIYMMPRTKEGDIDVIISLREVDFERLERDEIWRGYAQKIG